MATNVIKKYNRQDIDHIRQSVHCAVLLEKNGFKLDPKESSKKHLKYKNNGQTIIVSHEGRGWWNPHGTDKGDVLALQKMFYKDMSFLEVVDSLISFAGILPTFPEVLQKKKDKPPVSSKDILEKKLLQQNTECWDYLSKKRGLPSEILFMAIKQKIIRQGIKGTSLFLHKKLNGKITGAEMRGPEYQGFTNGGTKTLFYFIGGIDQVTRLVIVESAIDALSFAALDPITNGTLYVSTGGGIGPETIVSLEEVMKKLIIRNNVMIEIGTDKDQAGNNFADLLYDRFQKYKLHMRRITPIGNTKDWNEVLINNVT